MTDEKTPAQQAHEDSRKPAREVLERLSQIIPGSRVETDGDGLSKLNVPIAPER